MRSTIEEKWANIILLSSNHFALPRVDTYSVYNLLSILVNLLHIYNMSFLSYIYVYVYINFLVLFTKHTNTDGDCVLAKHCNVTKIHCIASTLSLLPFPFAFYTFSVVSQYVFFFAHVHVHVPWKLLYIFILQLFPKVGSTRVKKGKEQNKTKQNKKMRAKTKNELK